MDQELEEIKKMKNWYLEQEDFEHISSAVTDWGIDFLFENGIFSKSSAYNYCHWARFDYDNEDCPSCGSLDGNWKIKEDLWKCKKCKKQYSIFSSTYLADSKLEYYHWCRFAYLIGNLKVTNSMVIAKDLSISQKSSWWMIDTLRKARKETTETKFVNGAEVLVFDSTFEVLRTLLMTKGIKQ